MKHYPLLIALGAAVVMQAQQPPATPREPLPNMQAIAEALGVTCEYCHARGPQGNATTPAVGPSKISVAKQMIAMTRELNARIETATGKAAGTPAGAAVKIECATCHRGVPIPKPLQDVIWETNVKQGTEAAAEHYRDLRKRYYGKATYDFSEATLVNLVQRIANARPDDAVAFARLNLEFYPDSSTTYQALAFAYTRKVDDANAIAALEKAVEFDPTNNVARGQLEQLKSYQRRR
jgi:tetratricopeptide (TPR) repeat protein